MRLGLYHDCSTVFPQSWRLGHGVQGSLRAFVLASNGKFHDSLVCFVYQSSRSETKNKRNWLPIADFLFSQWGWRKSWHFLPLLLLVLNKLIYPSTESLIPLVLPIPPYKHQNPQPSTLIRWFQMFRRDSSLFLPLPSCHLIFNKANERYFE